MKSQKTQALLKSQEALDDQLEQKEIENKNLNQQDKIKTEQLKELSKQIKELKEMEQEYTTEKTGVYGRDK